MTYVEKLKDPRWQKKRLQIFERDGFSCRLCGCKTRTLNVHHHIYHQGSLPWEYNDDVLETQCDLCHSLVEFVKKMLKDSVLVANIFYVEQSQSPTDYCKLCYVIIVDKQTPILALFKHFQNQEIEFLFHIPTKVIHLMSSLTSINKHSGE